MIVLFRGMLLYTYIYFYFFFLCLYPLRLHRSGVHLQLVLTSSVEPSRSVSIEQNLIFIWPKSTGPGIVHESFMFKCAIS